MMKATPSELLGGRSASIAAGKSERAGNAGPKHWLGIVLLILALVFFVSPSRAAIGDFTLLHSFAGGADDGWYPQTMQFYLVDSTLYGVAYYGGDFNNGVIYSMNTDGTGFTLLHEFASGAGDGSRPKAGMVLSGNTLYGVTVEGGASNFGVVYSIDTDGSNFTVLHEFAGGADDGKFPYGDLVLDGSSLYGVTFSGGDFNKGTIYSIGTDGSGFSLVHEFAAGADDGGYPMGGLVISGSTLYGATRWGGDSDKGTVFSVGTDGAGFTLLHEFVGGANDGSEPWDGLLLVGSTLYGTTYYGGDSNKGTLFSIGTDGGAFTLLHEFAGGAGDGSGALGRLAYYDSKLYGATPSGGSTGAGAMFVINPDGSGFSVLHECAYSDVNNATQPYAGAPTLAGGYFYGTSRNGGTNNDGVIFRLEIGETTPPPPIVAPSPVGDAEWTEMTSNTTDNFTGVWITGGPEAFACGAGGRVQHYESGAWSQMTSNTTDDLAAIWASGASDVFTVGAGGRVQHFNGTAWSQMTSNTTDDLMSVWGSGATDVFATGAGGRIQHYDGAWSQMTSNTTADLNGVWGAAADNVFAVGAGGAIMHYNGIAWSSMASYTTNTLRAVFGTSGTDVWAVGDGGAIGHYDGASWTKQASGMTSARLGGVYCLGQEVFVVGEAGWILRYDGTAWSSMISGTTEDLAALWGSSELRQNDYSTTDSTIYAVGTAGTVLEFLLSGSSCFIQTLLR